MERHKESDVQGLDDAGSRAWREVCGEAYFERARTAATALDRERLAFVNNEVFGRTWTRQIIPRPILSLVTLGLLAGADRWEEFELHFRNALVHTGVPPEHLKELLFHINIYCGVPAGRNAMKTAQKVIAALGIDIEQTFGP